MIDRLLQRMALARRRLTRITPGPLLVRAAVLVTALLAQVLAWPGSLLLSRVFGLLALVALAAALSPRRFGPTVAVLAAAAGWLLDTGWYDQRIVLWRLLGLATLLYLTHSLCALAALLPYDAVVDPVLLARWVAHALLVALAGAVLSILLLALTGRTGAVESPAALPAGLVVAVLAAALLGWLLRREQR